MLHHYLTVNNQTTWTMTSPKRSRNRFSAFYIESDPETEWSGGLEYLSAEEQTKDHPQPKALYKSDSESEELDLLASSTIIEGIEPLEPRPWNITDPFQWFITAILEGQRESELIDIKFTQTQNLTLNPEWNNQLLKTEQRGLNWTFQKSSMEIKINSENSCTQQKFIWEIHDKDCDTD